MKPFQKRLLVLFLLCTALSILVPLLARAQTLARTYTTESDRAGGVQLFSFYNPSDKKTYVLNGDPNSFALPVTGNFTTTAGPVQYVRDGVDTEALVDNVTPSNNRPLPFSLFTGDSGGPAQFGVGASGSSTLRVHVGNSSLDVNASQAGAWNVGVTSSVLPAGAATSANQVTANSSLSSIDGKLTGVATAANQATTNTSLSSIDGKTPALVSGRVPVDGSGVTQPISAVSLPLPAGAATAANQATANASLSSIDTKAVQQALDFGAASGGVRTAAQFGNATGAADFGAGAASAQTLRVVTANGANPRLGKSVVFTSTTGLSASPLGTAYLQLSSSLSGAVSECAVFWPSDQPLRFATGAAASEVVLVNVPPGGIDRIPVTIAAGTRVAVRAEASTVSSGYLVVTCYGE